MDVPWFGSPFTFMQLEYWLSLKTRKRCPDTVSAVLSMDIWVNYCVFFIIHSKFNLITSKAIKYKVDFLFVIIIFMLYDCLLISFMMALNYNAFLWNTACFYWMIKFSFLSS